VGTIFVGPIADVTMLNDVGMVKGLIQAKKPLGAWAQYVRSHPTDLRRAYVASGVADSLVRQTLLGTASRDRDFRLNGLKPARWDKAPHASLVGSRPAKYSELKPTPTPGIGKNK
jgi:hypothetical protein